MATISGAIRSVAADAVAWTEGAAGGPARLQIVTVLGAVIGLDAADKAALSAVAGSLKSAFHISNTEVGLLIAVTSLVGAIFTLPGGVLADRSERKRILLITVALWTAATVVSGTATSFAYLLIARLFLGALTAAAIPAIASLIGDFFPAEARSRAYGLILAGEIVGIGFGFLIAGEISVVLDWRWALYVMGLPGAAVGFVIWRFLTEPERGGQSWIRLGQEEVPKEAARTGRSTAARSPPQETKQEASEEAVRPRELARDLGIKPWRALIMHEDPRRWGLWRAMRYLLRIPTYRLIIIVSTLGYYFFAGVRAFAVIYLTQHYHVSRGTVIALALVVGIGGLAGVIGGGRVSEWLLRRGRIDARIVVPGIALLLSAILIAPAVWTTNLIVGTALLTGGAAALVAANPPIDAARLDIVPAGLWGRGEAGRMALRGAFEAGAPILFGAMSGWLGGDGRGLELTFLIMLIPVIIAAALAIPASRAYPRDVATADASMRETRAARHRRSK